MRLYKNFNKNFKFLVCSDISVKKANNIEASGSNSLLKSIYIQNEQFMEEDKRILNAEEQELQVLKIILI